MFTKALILSSALLAASMAQRPPYAGSRPIGRPDLASRFKGTEESTTVAFDNRIGSDGATINIPTDARGDADLVYRLNEWPRENRPFWLLNADHIEKQRHPDESVNNFGSNQQGFQTQSRFGETNFGANGHNHFAGNRDDINFNSRSNFDETRTIRPPLRKPGFSGSA